MRWKDSGETTTDEGHKLYYSGDERSHIRGVGFLVHKDTVNTVMGCYPISSRLMTIRLRAAPFNITVIQVYAPTTDYEEEQVEDFYNKLQNTIDKVPKKDILVVQGDWNAKVGNDTHENGKNIMGTSCNAKSNERGLRLLEFATYNSLVLANTLGIHKPSRRWTWHSPGDKYHNQIDYILVQQRFRSSVMTANTRSFPGADIGSDYDLLLLNFHLRLKMNQRPKQTRVKFDLGKLNDTTTARAYQETLAGKLATIQNRVDDMDIDTMTNDLNTAITDTAEEILGKERRIKQPWMTRELLEKCDRRRELKNKKGSTEGAAMYRLINKEIKKGTREAKEKWIGDKCKEIEDNLKRNNNKRAYHVVNELTNERKTITNVIKDKSGKCLT